VLVGFMGAGKSTVGPLLAARLGWDFLDMDARIEERLGMSVAECFRRLGEEAFREEERKVALDLVDRERVVIAAGGGAFARDDTRGLLKRNAVTVWLRCGLDAVLRRVPADGRRPLAGNRAIMAARLAEREPSYREADVHVATEEAEPELVVDRVVSAVRERVGS
jgi:shikimate kinase